MEGCFGSSMGGASAKCGPTWIVAGDCGMGTVWMTWATLRERPRTFLRTVSPRIRLLPPVTSLTRDVHTAEKAADMTGKSDDRGGQKFQR